MALLAATWFGTLPAWLTFVAIVSAALALRGGQLGPAVGYLRDANRTLSEENATLHAQLREKDAEILALHSRTDLAPIQQAMLEAMERHEERASQRFDQSMVILGLIAERLGTGDGETS